MRFFFKKQIRICSKDPKTGKSVSKIFNKGEQEVETNFRSSKYFEAMLANGHILQTYQKSDIEQAVKSAKDKNQKFEKEA